MARCYIRNGVWGWSPEEQEERLAGAGKVSKPDDIYRDILPAIKAKKPSFVKPEWLEVRNDHLLRQTRGRPEEIAVATLLALAPSEGDLVAALDLAWKRKATVTAVDSGISLPPDAGVAGVNAAIKDWQRAKASARTKPGRAIGWQAAAAKKRDDTDRKLPLARPHWFSRKPDRLSVAQIEAISGLSQKTLYNRLHARPAIERRKSRGK